MRFSIITYLALCVALSSCADSGYKQFYNSLIDPQYLPDVQLLARGEAPKVYSSDDIQRDVKIARSKGFVPLGVSSFNGALESGDAVVAQAKKVGAVLVLVVNAQFTETRSITTPLFLPNNQTTYHSGAVGSTVYSGTSTTYGSTVVPITTEQQRYDQEAVYFAKSPKKPKYGLAPMDLTPELRARLERNSGAVIDIVAENSPAFDANVLPGDILIELDGISVINAEQAVQLMLQAAPDDGISTLKVIRNGAERLIDVKLD